MIFHPVAQRSPEWQALRLGIPTSSEFHRIITAQKGELSKSASRYAHALVAEMLLGEAQDARIGELEWVARGRQLEPHAVQQYEFETDCDTRPGGFCTTDDGRMGCSPDRLMLAAAGAVEIKCTAPATHMGLLMDGPGDDYRQQVQGTLLITDLDFVDFYGYHPNLPPACWRTGRDEPFIAKMRAALAEFCDMKDAMLARALASGFYQDRAVPRLVVPA